MLCGGDLVGLGKGWIDPAVGPDHRDDVAQDIGHAEQLADLLIRGRDDIAVWRHHAVDGHARLQEGATHRHLGQGRDADLVDLARTQVKEGPQTAVGQVNRRPEPLVHVVGLAAVQVADNKQVTARRQVSREAEGV